MNWDPKTNPEARKQLIANYLATFKANAAQHALRKDFGRDFIGVGGSSVPVDMFANLEDAATAFVDQTYTAVELVQPTATRNALTATISGNGRTLIPIPIVFPEAWQDPSFVTVSRESFNEGVSLVELAKRVAALIEDLRTVGIIQIKD